MFRTAIVGCGGIGGAHAAAWSRIPEAQLAFVVDKIPEKAQALADNYGCEALTDISQLPADIGCVSVTTPPAAHYPVVKALLERGYNVFCEKPLTLHPEQGDELVCLADARGTKLAVGFKMRYEPIFQKAKELLSQVGPLVSIVTT